MWIVEHHEVPLAQVNLIVRSGSAADPIGKYGVGSLTAAMLDEGAGTRSSLELADAIEFLGANLSTDELVRLLGGAHVGAGVEAGRRAAADGRRRAAARRFRPPSSIGCARSGSPRCCRRATTPRRSIQLAFPRIVFGPTHRYGTSANGLPPAIEALTVDDLRAFYRAHYRPDNATLLVVGDVTPASVLPMLEKAFGGVEDGGHGAARRRRADGAAARPSARSTSSTSPARAQSQIRIGWVGVPRSTPDYAALEVLNTILGGSFTSRLNQNLREKNGYSLRRQLGVRHAAVGRAVPRRRRRADRQDRPRR